MKQSSKSTTKIKLDWKINKKHKHQQHELKGKTSTIVGDGFFLNSIMQPGWATKGEVRAKPPILS